MILIVLVLQIFQPFEKESQVVDKVVVVLSNELYLNYFFASIVQLLENKFQVEANCLEKVMNIIIKKYNLNLHVIIASKI